MRRGLGLALLLIGLAAARPLGAAEEKLVVDLSTHKIEIDSRFTGKEVIMFGATKSAGDVIVVVRGPNGSLAVRRKERSAGFWFNEDSVEFGDVPLYYTYAASAPVERILPEALRAERQIGVDYLKLAPRSAEREETIGASRAALVRERVRHALYAEQAGVITFIDANLFRVSLVFPASIPTGPYQVDVLLVDQGRIVAERTTPLVVTKIGAAAQLFDFAHRQSAAYAAIAIAAALLAGWLGYIVFRKI